MWRLQSRRHILGYRKEKTYAAAAKDTKREETGYGQGEREETNRIKIGIGASVKTSPDQTKAMVRVAIAELGQKRKGEKNHETWRKTEQGKHKEKIRNINWRMKCLIQQ